MLTIYRITNRINGNVYIGQTSCGINLRWARHIISAFKVHRKRARSPFHKALYESGNVSHFKIEEVKVVENRIANDEEKKLIEKYTKKGNSYNRQQRTFKGRHHTEETKRKIAASHLGRKRSKAECKAISLGKLGKPQPNIAKAIKKSWKLRKLKVRQC